jgi:hypothetical protein
VHSFEIRRIAFVAREIFLFVRKYQDSKTNIYLSNSQSPIFTTLILNYLLFEIFLHLIHLSMYVHRRELSERISQMAGVSVFSATLYIKYAQLCFHELDSMLHQGRLSETFFNPATENISLVNTNVSAIPVRLYLHW